MRTLPTDLAQIRPRAVCRRRPAPRAASWRRPRIEHGLLYFIAVRFERVIRQRTPWMELYRLLEDHVPATGAERQRGVRDDLINSLVLVVWALLAAMRIRCLRVGRYVGRGRKHGFVGLTVARIVEWTGLSEATVSRVLSLLREAGLVHGPGGDGATHVIDQPCDRTADGSYDWHPAVRQFSQLFFTGLGKDVEIQLAELRSPKTVRPEPGICAEQGIVQKANRAREARLSRQARPPDG